MSKLCEICGKEIPDGEEFEMDGQVLCKECFDETYTTCDCCGAIVRIDSTTRTGDDKTVCEDCLSDEYTRCDDCGEYVPNDEVYNVDTRHWEFVPGRGYIRVGGTDYVCGNCLDNGNYFQCSDCGEWHTNDRRELSDDDYDICSDCADNWRVCADCGCVIRESSVYWDDDEPYCYDCYSEHSHRCIHDYGYKPTPLFGTTDDTDGRAYYRGTDFTFGVELECDKGRRPGDAAYDIQDLTDRVYCKHDGSLDNGYEVVTMPGTLAWHMTKFPWADIVRISRDYDFTSHDARTCGLHIHIGRDQFGKTCREKNAAVARLILLTNAVWPEICHFSRRNGDMHWSRCNNGFDAIRAGMTEDEAVGTVLECSSNDRYYAVNIRNDATVELRFNRGTLKLVTIYACIQLASNLAEFAKTRTMNECITAKWDDVVHIHDYDELNSYVASRFASFDETSVARPTTSFRTELARQVQEQAEAIPAVTVSEAYGLLLDRDYALAEEDTTAEAGELIVLVRDPWDIRGSRGPRAMAFGTCLDNHGFLYNDHYHTMHCDSRDDLPARQWFTGHEAYRVVRELRNHTPAPRREALLALAERGLTIGDTVEYSGELGVVSYVRRLNPDAYEVLLHFDSTFDGHDGGMFDDHHAWWVLLDDIHAIDPAPCF